MPGSSNTVTTQTTNQLTVNTDLSKIFIRNNRYDVANYTNGTGGTVNLLAGTLMGRIGASQKITPLDSAAVDGSQFPVGVLAEDYTVLNGATVQLTYCNSGDIPTGKIILKAGDTMATLVSSRSIYDRIGSDTVGVKLVASTDNSDYDN